LLYIGDILNPHGLKGAVIVFSHTRPAQAAAGYLRWYIGKTEGSAKPYTLKNCHQHGKRLLAKLEGLDTIEAVEPFKGMKIFIDADEVPVDEDEFLWEDLKGCIVIDQDQRVLGKVSALYEFGAQDNLEITTLEDAETPGEWLIPFIDDVILDVDVDNKRIEVELPEGMDVCFTPKS